MILITGATGLLGSHLLYSLVQQGKKVRAIHRPGSNLERVGTIFSYYTPQSRELIQKIEWFEADLLDQGAMEDALSGVEEVYHAGAVVSFHPSDHQKMMKTNVNGTAQLVNLCLDHGVKRFCHVSSIATLGRNETRDVATEETYWVPSGKNSVYSLSKYGAEREVWRGIEEGLNAVIVNPSVILGPGFWETNSGLFRLVHQGLSFYTKGMNGYVDVRDVAEAMIALTNGEHFGQRFICSAENISYQALFALMAKRLNKKEPSIYVSPLLSSVAWRAEWLRALLLAKKPTITKETANTASQVYRYSGEKLLKALPGFRFRSVEESVADTCRILLQEFK